MPAGVEKSGSAGGPRRPPRVLRTTLATLATPRHRLPARLPGHGGGVRRGDYALVRLVPVGGHRAVPAGDLDRVGAHPLCKLPLASRPPAGARSRCSMQEPSAQAPWTSTMLGDAAM